MQMGYINQIRSPSIRVGLTSHSSNPYLSGMRIINHTSYQLTFPHAPTHRSRSIQCTIVPPASADTIPAPQRITLRIPLVARFREGWVPVRVVWATAGEEQGEKEPLIPRGLEPALKVFYKSVCPLAYIPRYTYIQHLAMRR